MSKDDKVIIKAIGLNTQPNEFGQPDGSLAVCENLDITRDNVAQLSVGFEDYSDNLPDFIPEQLLSSGTSTYLNLDGGIWYHNGSQWLRKNANLGSSIKTPYAVTSDLNNDYDSAMAWVSSSDGVIYRITTSNGNRISMCGLVGLYGSTDGATSTARFSNSVKGLSFSANILYVCDTGNHTIRKITSPALTATVSTFAGTAGASGSTDATGTSARFNGPTGICTDGTNLYVCDTGNHTVRKIVISSGVVTTLAGTAGASGSTDATGSSARFNGPTGIAISPLNTNYAYVCDTGNHTIRRIDLTTGVVTTNVGTAGASGTTDGIGSAARMNGPSGLAAFQGLEVFLLADTQNDIIRVFSPLLGVGTVTTPLMSGTFSNPYSLYRRGQYPGSENKEQFFVCDTDNNQIKIIYYNSETATYYAPILDGRPDGYSSPVSNSGLPHANGIIVGPP